MFKIVNICPRCGHQHRTQDNCVIEVKPTKEDLDYSSLVDAFQRNLSEAVSIPEGYLKDHVMKESESEFKKQYMGEWTTNAPNNAATGEWSNKSAQQILDDFNDALRYATGSRGGGKTEAMRKATKTIDAKIDIVRPQLGDGNNE